MSPRIRRSSHQYELLPRSSNDSSPPYDRPIAVSVSWRTRLSHALFAPLRCFTRPSTYTSLAPRRHRRGIIRILLWALLVLSNLLVLLVLFTTAFLPSYTHRPSHYNDLRRSALESTTPGRANPRNETVFIASSIYERNGSLTGGAWGEAMLGLVDLLGPKNVYLSIYANDPDPQSKASLSALLQRVNCNSTFNDEELSMHDIPRVTLFSGEKRVKRIAFLAETRNRALLPMAASNVSFERLLFVNDVMFDPIEAAQLLLSTNVDATGRATYGAACAVDFINPFKFYDRFATRDLDGYSMGIPFYPWFTDAGSQTSRQDVLAGKDAVRVRSCWGGMTAFEAKWFQERGSQDSKVPANASEDATRPLRFRFEEEIFWDSSECCLINADLQYRRSGRGMPEDSGIYMNPFIRVAYDERSLGWLAMTRRPERLYAIIHNILNHMVGFPFYNPRRTEEPGKTYIAKEWDPEVLSKPVQANESTNTDTSQKYHKIQRIARPGGFCGGRKLLLLNEHPQRGESKWENVPIPPPP